MIRVVHGSVVDSGCDAVVNAANNQLLRGSGVCGAIFAAAGEELDNECAEIGWCDTGDAVITGAYDLDTKYIIHTVGPVYEGHPRDGMLLSRCYTRCMDLASMYHCDSIAFPCISCGIYGFPLEEACAIAVESVKAWMHDHGDLDVFFYGYNGREYEVLYSLVSTQKSLGKTLTN